jgi:hypothetical protein
MLNSYVFIVVLLSVGATIDRSGDLFRVIFRILRSSVHSDLASISVGMGAKQASPMTHLRHVQPFASADETAASISLLGCLGRFTILAPII